MRYFLLYFLSTLLSISWVYAQQVDKPWKFGVSADALLSRTASIIQQDVPQAGGGPLGGGRQFALWTSYQLQPQQALRLSLAYRILGDYQRRESRGERVYTPVQVQDFLYTKELLALHYLDTELSWEIQWAKKPRWRIQIGGRVGFLANVQGVDRADLMVRGLAINNEETETRVSNYYLLKELHNRPLDRASYADLDFGLTLGLLFELTKGLDLRLGGYEGFQKVLGPGTAHRIRSLNLGVQARLF